MKFKVGDRVKCVDDIGGPGIHVGQVYTITEVNCSSPGLWFIKFRDDDGALRERTINEFIKYEGMTVAVGAGLEAMEKQATKHDSAKPDLSLLPKEALWEVAKVLDFGAKKYDRYNWRKGMDWSRMISAAMRHITQFNEGEDKDPETGLSHIAHANCCLMFLLTYIKEELGVDNRYKL